MINFKSKKTLFISLLVLSCVVAIVGCKTKADKPKAPVSKVEEKQKPEIIEDPKELLPSASIYDWNLILVNPEHRLPSELDIKLKEYPNNMKIDDRISQSFDDMVSKAKADGIDLYLRSSYRTISLQQSYYDSTLNSYLNAGNSKEVAKRKTEEYIAIPGASEHHTGLSLDIISVQWQNEVYDLVDAFDQTDAFKWLDTHAADYGFILRYPKGKESLTKINYEPWHYRYVGPDNAKYIKEHNLCLEEYVSLLK